MLKPNCDSHEQLSVSNISIPSIHYGTNVGFHTQKQKLINGPNKKIAEKVTSTVLTLKV